jgi:diguanylate cyclase (GGDEF)-like protein/PAS domain S-box-containing protein
VVIIFDENVKMMKSLSDIASFLEFLGQPVLIINDKSKIVFANTACLSLFGYLKDEMLKLRIDDLIIHLGNIDHSKLAKSYIRSNSPPKEMTKRSSISCVNSAGKRFDTKISIANANIDDELYGVAILQDYTSIQSVISELESESNRDALTGLYNRRYLQKTLKADSRILTTWCSIGVLYLDLDKFKPINDNLGHKAGDEILKVIAVRLQSLLRFDDIILRVGGDEFMILLNLTKVSDKLSVLGKIGHKICNVISAPITLEKNRVEIGISIGAGVYPDDISQLTELIHATDKAMYFSKKNNVPVTFVRQFLDK